MENILFIIVLVLIFYIGYKNIVLLSRYKINKKYIAVYQNALNDTETAYEDINNFINSCKTNEFINKARILKLYVELHRDLDFSSTLTEINLKDIFYVNGKLSNSNVNLNSDSFIFIMLCMAKAHNKGKKEVITQFHELIAQMEELGNHIEYQEIIALYEVLLKVDNKGFDVFNSLLEGTYTGYHYEKNLIGLYKRFASVALVYDKKQIDEYYENDLYKFSQTLIGKCLMKDLGIYDKYQKAQ